ncbi:hypothetical protein N7495_004261 [Penicillium taxi]|uniref:uncharacterized protein n=1 Tax=Penicillium taxi TaxID=168475 RepID=UPI002545645A|nr:uncharacterized protein N7495_004261 [Penicillium taxi]KAJ5899517.1 hypothetical protein N7495_004261 [Penicillium taxi]
MSSSTRSSRIARVPAHHQRDLDAFKQRSTSIDVGSFFNLKMRELENELMQSRCFINGLTASKQQGIIGDKQFHDELEVYLQEFFEKHSTSKIMKREAEFLEEDFQDAILAKKPRHGEMELEFLERSYCDTIIPRVMAASNNALTANKSKKSKQSQFRADVHEYYGISGGDDSFCHVLNMHLNGKLIKAAHIVPKCLSPEEVAHLFGQEMINTMDARNGLLLHRCIENALDCGDIVIVPVGSEINQPSRWKCVLINEARRNDIIWQGFYQTPNREIRRSNDSLKRMKLIKSQDIDGKELTFTNDHRPRKRFLYFRFLISYLWAKRKGREISEEKVQARRVWPTIGRYLRKSTLQALSRCISGSELDHKMAEAKFDGPDDEANEEAGYTMSKSIIDKADHYSATVDSISRMTLDEETSDSEGN